MRFERKKEQRGGYKTEKKKEAKKKIESCKD
jgi:hypothetical protein